MQNSIAINKNLLFAALAVLLALGAAAYVVLSPQPAAAVCGTQSASGVCGAGTQTQNPGSATAGNEIQEITIKALPSGDYDNPSLKVKAGVPVRLTFIAEPGSGCGQFFVMEEFNIRLISRNGAAVTADFIPTKAGEYPYHCGMWMFKGKLMVV